MNKWIWILYVLALTSSMFSLLGFMGAQIRNERWNVDVLLKLAFFALAASVATKYLFG